MNNTGKSIEKMFQDAIRISTNKIFFYKHLVDMYECIHSVISFGSLNSSEKIKRIYQFIFIIKRSFYYLNK